MKRFWRWLISWFRSFRDRADANREEWRMRAARKHRKREHTALRWHRIKMGRGCSECGKQITCHMGYHCHGQWCMSKCSWCSPKAEA